jgi:hypothetical protein
MDRAELAGLVSSMHAIPRTARKPWRCVCADELLDVWEVTADHGGGHTTTYGATGLTLDKTRDTMAERYPDAEISATQRRNRNYPDRAPDCLGDIPPGTAYVEYLGESAAYEHGYPYCQRCGVKVWAKANWS